MRETCHVRDDYLNIKFSSYRILEVKEVSY
jgi:hypothetical protein